MKMRYSGVWPTGKENSNSERNTFVSVSPFSREFKKVEKLQSFKYALTYFSRCLAQPCGCRRRINVCRPRGASVRQKRLQRKSAKKRNLPPKAALMNRGETFLTASPFSPQFEMLTNLPPFSVLERHASLFMKATGKSKNFTPKRLKSIGMRQAHLQKIWQALGSACEDSRY